MSFVLRPFLHRCLAPEQKEPDAALEAVFGVAEPGRGHNCSGMKPSVILTALAVPVLAGLGGWQPGSAEQPGRFSLVQRTLDREVAVDFTAPAGGIWRVDTTSDLQGWEGWVSFTSAGVTRHLDSAAAYHPQRFYRAIEVASATPLTGDHFATQTGDAVIHPVNHASFVIGWDHRVLYVDPVGGAERYRDLPRADLILLTHEHGDHLHTGTIESVRGPDVAIVASQAAFNGLSPGLKTSAQVLTNGARATLLGLTVEAVPAYNLTTSNHPKGNGNGYVLTLGGKRLYISGDTEDTPELRALRDIDIAFVAMNVPYTMAVAKAASAVREFRPKVVYPYHYRNADGTFADLETFKWQVGTDLGIEVRLRKWY